jgi:hypothetical protein
MTPAIIYKNFKKESFYIFGLKAIGLQSTLLE